jgi:GcrA cell cycle regulator
MGDPRWPQERKELVKRLWLEGYSASQIAAEIGGFTRNAIIGVVTRLGLQRGADVVRKVRVKLETRERVRRVRTRQPPTIPAPKVVPSQPVKVEPVTIWQLNSTTCRWPLGEFGEPVVLFCGAMPVEGVAYCPEHCRTAFQPALPRLR